MNIIFFGSSTDSLLVLEKLTGPPVGEAGVVAVVTQPPKPVGRKKFLTPTPVEIWARKHHVPVFTEIPQMSVDLIITASYGEKIPIEFIRSARFGGLNVHPSFLPRWRGGDPVPWAILSGDREAGVSVVTLSEKFDQGRIIAQKAIPISDTDMSDPLRTRLFTIGADLLLSTLPDYLSGKNKGKPQKTDGTPYARRLTREDGFEPWEKIMDPKESERINRKYRAFHPWPGLWTRLPAPASPPAKPGEAARDRRDGGQATFNGKRLKILEFKETSTVVQMEGKKPVSWEQFHKAYIPS